jgi:hypothetical protein
VFFTSIDVSTYDCLVYPVCAAETTAMNPQFHIQIPRTSSNKCHVVVSVTQFYETLPDTRKKKPLFAIGFAVYEVPHATARLTPHFVAEQVPTANPLRAAHSYTFFAQLHEMNADMEVHSVFLSRNILKGFRLKLISGVNIESYL